MAKKILNGSVLPTKWCIQLSSRAVNDLVNELKITKIPLKWEDYPVYTSCYVNNDGGYDDGEYDDGESLKNYKLITYKLLESACTKPTFVPPTNPLPTPVYRIKTEQEFIDEFGYTWENRITPGWNPDGKMDYLFGRLLTETEFKKLSSNRSIEIDRWYVGKDYITTKSLPVSTSEYRIKTEEEFIRQYGECFWERVQYRWVTEMNPNFGTPLSPKETELFRKNGAFFRGGNHYSKDMVCPTYSLVFIKWGEMKLTIDKINKKVNCRYGIISKQQVENLLTHFTNAPSIFGYTTKLASFNDNAIIAIGCQKDTVGKLKQILKLLNE